LHEHLLGTTPKKSTSTEFIFFIAINVLVVPFSAYQTYAGYLDVAGNQVAAIAIAAISGLLFAAMNFGIRERRLNGKKHLWQTLMYIIPLGISFVGNFNAFYSNQMQNQSYDHAISGFADTLRITKSDAINELDNWTGLSTLEKEYNQLVVTITSNHDIPPRGWGDSCRFHYNSLKLLLEAEGGAPLSNCSDALNPKLQVAANYFEAIKKDKNRIVDPLKIKIVAEFDSVMASVAGAKSSGTLNEKGIVLLNAIKLTNNTIGFEVDAFMQKNDAEKFEFSHLDPSAQNQLGTIKYALHDAFVTMPNASATYFSLFLALIIDLAALLYILFFIRYNKPVAQGRISGGPRQIN
jgi:hypothetical protein